MRTTEIAPEWERWAAAHVLREADLGPVVDQLVAAGVPEDQVQALIRALNDSPVMAAARQALVPAVEAVRLRRTHLRMGPVALPRKSGLDPDTFLSEHVATQHPVVLTDATQSWPARRWTFAALAERVGDPEVQVCVGRRSQAQADREWEQTTEPMSFGSLLRKVQDPELGNDVYLIGRNRALNGPLAPLLADLEAARPWTRGWDLPECALLWIGGAGANTVLHHDRTDILFNQLVGRKAFWMAPPEELIFRESGDGVWCDLDLFDPVTRAETLAGVALRHAVLEPGESLLLPAGWWHQVRALDPCISVSIVGQEGQTDLEWFNRVG